MYCNFFSQPPKGIYYSLKYVPLPVKSHLFTQMLKRGGGVLKNLPVDENFSILLKYQNDCPYLPRGGEGGSNFWKNLYPRLDNPYYVICFDNSNLIIYFFFSVQNTILELLEGLDKLESEKLISSEVN